MPDKNDKNGLRKAAPSSKTKNRTRQTKAARPAEGGSRRNAAWEQKVSRQRRMLVLAVLLVILAAVLFGVWLVKRGTFETWPEENLLSIDADGTVCTEELMDLGGSDFDTLKSFVKEEVGAYNDEWAKTANPGSFDRKRPVTIERLLERDGKVYLRIRYDNASTYQAFTSYELEILTVEGAVDAGYNFTDPFDVVTDGQKGDTAILEQLLAEPDLAMIRIRENARIRVPGTIAFVTDANTDVEAKDTIRISPKDGNPDASVVTFIIYRPAGTETSTAEESKTEETAQDPAQSGTEGAETTGETAPEGGDTTGEAAPEGTESTLETVPEGTDSTGEAVPEGTEATGEAAPAATENGLGTTPVVQ